MEKQTAKRRSIHFFFRAVNLFPFIFFILLTIGVATFSALYVSLDNALFLY